MIGLDCRTSEETHRSIQKDLASKKKYILEVELSLPERFHWFVFISRPLQVQWD